MLQLQGRVDRKPKPVLHIAKSKSKGLLLLLAVTFVI